jgi:FkbM family methyltransferase
MASPDIKSKNVFAILARVAPPHTLTYLYKHILSAPILRPITDRALLCIIAKTVTIPEGVLWLDPADPVISGALTLGIFEPYETFVFRQLVRPGMVVVDIGANIGYYSVIAAKHVGEKGAVYAFEPEPSSRSFLEKNVRENACANVRISDHAIAETRGTARLNISKRNKGNHSIMSLKMRVKEFSTSIPVPTISLDEFRRLHHLTSVDLIKVDVEGAEELVLRGMEETLRQPTLTLCIEFFPEILRDAGSDPVKFLERIASYGFSITVMNSERRRLDLLTDFTSFANSFPKKEYCNLLCTKGDGVKSVYR